MFRYLEDLFAAALALAALALAVSAFGWGKVLLTIGIVLGTIVLLIVNVGKR